jgi:hypothetical protein
VSGGTPSTVGKIHSGSTTSPYNDQGAAGDASSVPAEIASNKPVLIGPDGSIYPDMLYAGETQLRRANPADMTDIHVKSLGGFTELEQLLVEA